MNFEDDFIKGWRDCEKGLDHQHRSEAYNRGYAAKYESEQVATVLTINQNERIRSQLRG